MNNSDFKILKCFLVYLFYETHYTTYVNHARLYRCLRSGGLRVWGNSSARRKPNCLNWWPHDHPTCRRRVLNPDRNGEGCQRACASFCKETEHDTLISYCFYFFLQRKYVDGNAPPLFLAPPDGAAGRGCGLSRGPSRGASRASVLGPASLQSVQKVLEWSEDDIIQWATDYKLE